MPVTRSIAHSPVLRLAIAASIVTWLMSRLDPATLTLTLQQVDPAWLLAGAAAMIIEGLLRCLNWHQVLTAIGIRVPSVGRLVQKYFLASFVGSLFPSSIGTDALRVAFGRELAGGSIGRHAFAVLATNAISFGCGALLVLAALAWMAGEQGAQFQSVALAATAALGLLLLSCLLLAPPRQLRLLLFRYLPVSGRLRFRISRAVLRFSLDLRRLRTGWARIGLGMLLALAMQSLAYALVGRAGNVELSIAAWLMVPTVVAIVGILPASFLGFGATQASVAGLLVILGNPEQQAIVTATTISLLALIVKVVGGLVAISAESAGAGRRLRAS